MYLQLSVAMEESKDTQHVDSQQILFIDWLHTNQCLIQENFGYVDIQQVLFTDWVLYKSVVD